MGLWYFELLENNVYLEDGDKVLAFRRKNTFSAVGLGQERIPFLSTQHKAWKSDTL